MCQTLEDAKEAKALEFSIGAGQVRVALFPTLIFRKTREQ